MRFRARIFNRFMAGSRALYGAAAMAVLLATIFGFLTPFVLRFTIDSVIGDARISHADTPAEAIAAPPSSPGFGGTGEHGSNGSGMVMSEAKRVLWGLPARISGRIWLCGLTILIITILECVFTVAKTIWASKAAEGFAERLRNALYDKVNRVPFLNDSLPVTGDVIQRCSSDVETVKLFVEKQAVEIWRILMMIAVSIPLMLNLDMRMTITSTVVLPLVVGCSIVYFMRVKELFQSSVELEARMTTVAQENLAGVRLVRAFQQQDYELNQFADANSAYRDRVVDMIQMVSLYWAVSAFLCMGQVVVTVLVGAMRVAHDTLTLGTFTVFVTYVGLLVWPVRLLGHVLSDLGRSYVSLGRIAEILDAPSEAPPGERLSKPSISGHIEFCNVSFSYGVDSGEVLAGISFEALPGQTVAIVGKTGSGKSTLVHLIPRLLDYTSGSIRIDGCELREIDRTWLRRHIGVVLQEPFLFSRTVRENIALGNVGDADDVGVLEAAETAAIHATIEHTFAEGYNTVIGERGVTLSGGQRQRLAIARAILPNPPVLIFDDSLSAVDAETDQRIRKALARHRGRATTFIVSHRIATVSEADLILVLEAGRIAQMGTHEELADQPGLYQRMCRIQDELSQEITESKGLAG